jgi:hypothetical protein
MRGDGNPVGFSEVSDPVELPQPATFLDVRLDDIDGLCCQKREEPIDAREVLTGEDRN